jgi:hypothetical protein
MPTSDPTGVGAPSSEPTVQPSQSPSGFCPLGTNLTKVTFSHNRDETKYYSHGDYVKDLGFGFTLSVAPGPGGKSTRKPRIYDSDIDNGADPDLEQNLGNLLIIQQEVQPDVPNDNRFGGTLTFKFDRPTNIKSIGLVDTEERVEMGFYSVNGRERVLPSRIANGTSQVVDVDKLEVDELKIQFSGSAGTSFIEMCAVVVG